MFPICNPTITPPLNRESRAAVRGATDVDGATHVAPVFPDDDDRTIEADGHLRCVLVKPVTRAIDPQIGTEHVSQRHGWSEYLHDEENPDQGQTPHAKTKGKTLQHRLRVWPDYGINDAFILPQETSIYQWISSRVAL